MKNTPKNTLYFRLACMALFAFDCLTLSLYPSAFSALVLWFCATVALVVAIAPIKSKFSL
jgi:hypothetical protein